MEFPELIPGKFVRRDNRFRTTLDIDGREVWAHVANSGRLIDLLTPGRRVWVSQAEKPNRKTSYDLRLVDSDDILVSVDARLPNPLFEEYLLKTPGVFGNPGLRREVRLGDSRLDFRLEGPEGICWVETKSVTFVEDGVARFPDAPTSRGRRHLLTLAEAAQKEVRTAVVFVVQRPDAEFFSPNEDIDPEFADILRQVAAQGVEIRAYKCQVSFVKIFINAEIPCEL